MTHKVSKYLTLLRTKVLTLSEMNDRSSWSLHPPINRSVRGRFFLLSPNVDMSSPSAKLIHMLTHLLSTHPEFRSNSPAEQLARCILHENKIIELYRDHSAVLSANIEQHYIPEVKRRERGGGKLPGQSPVLTEVIFWRLLQTLSK